MTKVIGTFVQPLLWSCQKQFESPGVERGLLTWAESQ